MKINKKKVFLVIMIIILIIVISFIIIFTNKNKVMKKGNENINEKLDENIEGENIIDENATNIINNEISVVDKNSVEYKEDSNVEELKKATGAKGDSNIYEVQSEFDGRKVLSVKSNIRYKTAFAGMIKKDIPKKEELDEIYNNYYPNRNGIWIEKDSRSQVLDLLNNGTSKYNIDNEGYLKINDKNTQNEADKKIEKAMSENRTIILDISNICYIVDDMTGDILDYNFEEMDKDQTYEYFEDNKNLIIFINENKDGLLTKKDIINSIVELF